MLPGRYPALLDANILHPAFLRGAMLWFATERLLRPCWSSHILEEWRRSVKRRFQDVDDDKINALQSVMTENFPEAEITHYEALIDCVSLPDVDDRHVLAAAIVGKCQGIVTCNTKHFPEEAAARFGIEIIHPDNFIVNIIDLDPTRALAACKSHRAAMSKTAPSPDDFLDRYKACGLIQAHTRLLKHKELL